MGRRPLRTRSDLKVEVFYDLTLFTYANRRKTWQSNEKKELQSAKPLLKLADQLREKLLAKQKLESLLIAEKKQRK